MYPIPRSQDNSWNNNTLNLPGATPPPGDYKRKKMIFAATDGGNPNRAESSTTQQENKDAGGYPTSYALRHIRYKYK